PGSFTRYTNTTLLGLWRTTTAWKNTPRWVQIPVTATDGGSGTLGYCASNPATGVQPQCHWNHVLSIDPQNPNVLYAGGIGLWKAEILCEKTELSNRALLREKCV